MLNMELSYGTEETLKSTFERAVTVTDALKMHKQMVKIYQNAGRNEVGSVSRRCFCRFGEGGRD